METKLESKQGFLIVSNRGGILYAVWGVTDPTDPVINIAKGGPVVTGNKSAS